MTLLDLAHSSGRYDRSNALLKREAATLRKQFHGITHTEQGTPARSDLLRAPGWSMCQGEKPGEDETVFEWSNVMLSLSGMPYAMPLTDMTFTRKSGKESAAVHALVTPVHLAKQPSKRIAIISSHMSLDNTPLRAKVWMDSAKGHTRLVKQIRRQDPGIKIVSVSDFNKNYRDPKERAMIQKHLCEPVGLKQAWDAARPLPSIGGTHGDNQRGPRQIIDGWLVDEDIEVVWCKLLADTKAADHRPIGMRIRV